MAPKNPDTLSEREISLLLSFYWQLEEQAAQHQTEIKGVEHRQALLIKMMNDGGLTYRDIASLIHKSSSRVHQLTASLRS